MNEALLLGMVTHESNFSISSASAGTATSDVGMYQLNTPKFVPIQRSLPLSDEKRIVVEK